MATYYRVWYIMEDFSELLCWVYTSLESENNYPVEGVMNYKCVTGYRVQRGRCMKLTDKHVLFYSYKDMFSNHFCSELATYAIIDGYWYECGRKDFG